MTYFNKLESVVRQINRQIRSHSIVELTNDEIHEWLSIRVMGTDETQLQLGYRVLFGCKSKLSRLQMEIVQDWAVARRLEMENFEAWLKE